MATTPLQGWPVPAAGDSPAGATQIANLGGAAEKQANMTYASAAARTTAIPTPTEGQETWLQDVNRKDIHDGTSWIPFIPGAKLIAQDAGSGQVLAANGTYTNHPSRTISDPLGTGVRYMLAIYGQTLISGASATGSLELRSPALSATMLKLTQITGTDSYSFLYITTFPSAGSASYSTAIVVTGGTPTFYNDPANNWIYYVALPMIP